MNHIKNGLYWINTTPTVKEMRCYFRNLRQEYCYFKLPKSEVTAQKELKDKLYDTCIFTAMQRQVRWPAAMAVELIKHVHLINFDMLEGIWPPEERSHEFHSETQNGTNIARALRIFVLKMLSYRKVSFCYIWYLFKITDLIDPTP